MSTREAPVVMPPRLHVLLARDARYGVVLRRGPTRQVCAIGWDRGRDTFTTGQWMRGRIYEWRSDLSPDGNHLIYFAMNGHWKSRALGSWTAISRAPWLTALTLYAKGDCWNGGGLFLSDREYWLNDGYGHHRLEDTCGLQRHAGDPRTQGFGGECPGVYFLRLQRDGWTMRPELAVSTKTSGLDVFERALPGGWTLRKLAGGSLGREPGRGVYAEHHMLIHAARGIEDVHADWEWADVDRDRLVWAAGGKLWAARLGAGGVEAAQLLHDFAPMTFEAREAPYARPTPVAVGERQPVASLGKEPKPKAKAKAKAKAKSRQPTGPGRRR